MEVIWPNLDAKIAIPPEVELETKSVMRQLVKASRALGELNGYVSAMPHRELFTRAVMFREAIDSCKLKGIAVSPEDLFRAWFQPSDDNHNAQKVKAYYAALVQGCSELGNGRALTTDWFMELKVQIESLGGRRFPRLKIARVREGLADLERYIADDSDGVDPLLKLGVIHQMFRRLKPFQYGTRRTGRLIAYLYLIQKQLIPGPTLLMSSHFLAHWQEYFDFEYTVGCQSSWEKWNLFFLTGIEVTARSSLCLAKAIETEIERQIGLVKAGLPKIFSDELAAILFLDLYITNQKMREGLGISRHTATKYLTALEREGILVSEMVGRERVFLNQQLMDLTMLY